MANDAKRLIVAQTPLGEDVLQLHRFSGREQMSHLFHYDLDFISDKDDISASEIVGKPITWEIIRQDLSKVYWNGIVSQFAGGVKLDGGTRTYKATVVPWLWFLTLTSNCRIYQDMKVPDIIEDVLRKQYGFKDYEINATGNHPKWTYCVQYRESAFDFISRLMELEGIFYYFRHEDGKHTMVMGDSKSAYKDNPDKQVDYTAVANPPKAVLTKWDHQFNYRTGKWSQTDYNFEKPGDSTYQELFKDENTAVTGLDNKKYEKYDYPGGYMVKPDAETKVRIETEDAGHEVVHGGGDIATFKVGNKFSLAKHDVPSEVGKGYALTGIQHQANDDSYLQSGTKTDYRNQFTAIPDSVVYRPPQETPKPFVKGPQTAVVVGPKGEEIFVDKYARVKVQFYWDRQGKKDEKSSCWIRVSEQWAGQKWGFIFHPRIGQEVIVDFLEGDPDRPIITGRVYNAQQMPPYDLDENKTQSGIKTRTTKEGTPQMFNEIRFEDKKDSELVYIHAQKDKETEVEHDQKHWIKHNRTRIVGNEKPKDANDPGGDEKVTIMHDQELEIKHNRTETVGDPKKKDGGDEKVTITHDRTHDIGNDDSLKVGNDRKEEVGNDRTADIKKNDTIKAGESITLQVGDNKIVIDQQGITLTGLNLKHDGKMTFSAKAPMVDVKATASHTIKGKPVLIN